MHFLALGLLLLGQADAVSPEDIWPQWRGPTGDSVALGKGLPTHWSRTENVVWKTPLPGWGNSTPAIWKDDIFVTTQDGERLLLLHIDRVSGKILWEREVGRGTPRYKGAVGNGHFHTEQNMATPSPTTDGRYVWAHFGTGDLACYRFRRRQKWAVNMTDKFGPYTIWHGHANSPILFGDLLISVCMQDPKGNGQSYVVALDKNTGDQKWLTKRITGAKRNPPIPTPRHCYFVRTATRRCWFMAATSSMLMIQSPADSFGNATLSRATASSVARPSPETRFSPFKA